FTIEEFIEQRINPVVDELNGLLSAAQRLGAVRFYTKIVRELLSFQQRKTRESFSAIPRCYFARSDLLILEDLCAKDYQMPNRQEGLSLQQTESVLVELARFHALSLAYKAEHPKDFEALTASIEEGIFAATNLDCSDLSILKLLHIVSQSFKNGEDGCLYVQRLRDFVDTDAFFMRMVDLVRGSSDLSVICHGDCWTNNFLYRYGTDRKTVSDVCLVDFQLIRCGSLTLDIANLIFCCTDHALRKEHLQDLLKLYGEELAKALKKFGSYPSFCGSCEEELMDKIHAEFKKYARFGLGLAMDILPISTCSADQAPDLYVLPTEDTSNSAPELNVPPNELCRQKMREIVVDLVDNGLL
uniref:CHK kinase-like domain-containing protein n=1 Tax=Phlebotomus papatasi TaxID=29031 RepID=A0A1B0D7X8_PHLPP